MRLEPLVRRRHDPERKRHDADRQRGRSQIQPREAAVAHVADRVRDVRVQQDRGEGDGREDEFPFIVDVEELVR